MPSAVVTYPKLQQMSAETKRKTKFLFLVPAKQQSNFSSHIILRLYKLNIIFAYAITMHFQFFSQLTDKVIEAKLQKLNKQEI